MSDVNADSGAGTTTETTPEAPASTSAGSEAAGQTVNDPKPLSPEFIENMAKVYDGNFEKIQASLNAIAEQLSALDARLNKQIIESAAWGTGDLVQRLNAIETALKAVDPNFQAGGFKPRLVSETESPAPAAAPQSE